MKKIILIIFTIILFAIPALADTLSSSISDVELNLFGFEYRNETDTQRIERIETQLYGSKKAGTAAKRLEAIRADMGLLTTAEKKQNEEIQNQKTAQQQQQLMQQQQLQQKQAELEKMKETLKEDASVDYPIVDKMEMELFKTQYKKENIYKRLDRLEEKVFLKKSNEPLNVRVDNLASIVLPRKSQRTAERDLTPEEMQNYYSNPVTQNPITNENIPFQLAVLEQGMFKTVYDRDNIANRLSRIEEKMFNRTFSTEPDVTRAQRLMVAYEAKQSSYKYENNKKMQNMASMSQLGGLLLMILAILL